MTMDQRNNHIGSTMGFDHLHFANGPQFTNPWSTGTPAHPQLFPNSNSTGFDALVKQQSARSTTTSIPYSSIPATAPSLVTGTYSYGSSSLLDMSQDLLNQPRSSYEQGYSTTSTSGSTYTPTSAPYVSSFGNVGHMQPQDDTRRLSHT